MNEFHRTGHPVTSRLWVVMFDGIARPASFDLPIDPEQLPIGTINFDAFDDLDIRTDYFEQFVAQNLCEFATEVDRLGGRQVLQTALLAIQRLGTIEAVRVSPTRDHADQDFDSGSIPELVSNMGGRTSVMTPNSESTKNAAPWHPSECAEMASLVWFSVASSAAEDRDGFQETVLRHIVSLQRALPESERPMLMVSGMKGIPRRLESPLESGLDENLIQLPLWIDRGLQHPRRIQSLVGSFDLVPTIADAFGCELPAHPEGTPEVSRPMSMLTADKRRFDGGITNDDPKAESGQHVADRILIIHGDDWSALRAQQYLLVQKAANMDDAGTHESESARQMFLKPDDTWNVNNMIVPFETIADEMEARVS